MRPPSFPRRPSPWLAAVVVTLAALPVAAHDMRLEPSSFTPAPGELVELRLRLGDQPQSAEPVARDERRIVAFTAWGPDDEVPVVGIDGDDPAGFLRPETPGLWAIGFVSTTSTLELPAERFEAYLAEEGLEAIIARRRERGESASPGRERFSRSLKTLLAAGGAEAGGEDRPRGLPLELVARGNPYAPAGGAPLVLSALFRGAPLAGLRVDARRLDGSGGILSTRTDGQGRASFALPAPGPWIFAAVHMVDAAAGSGADWESFWTTLTCAPASP